MPSNRLLPLFAGMILIMVIFIGMKSCAKSEPKNPSLANVPVAPQPDADSPADTVRTLTAQVADLKTQSAGIERQNQALLNQKTELESHLQAMLAEALQKQAATANPDVTVLSEQLAAVKNQLDAVTQNLPGSGSPSTDAPTAGNLVAAPVETVQWIEPLGATGAGFSLPVDLTGKGLTPLLQDTPGSPSGADSSSSPLAAQPVIDLPEPVYTVPRNATLIGSTAMTALIGKVPFKDTISDPFPFKVIVGAANLAANGITMPGLDGMVFSGHTSGDWTLGCVRGNVESVTFVFDDGTIRTLTGNGQTGSAGNASSTPINNMLGNGQAGGAQTQALSIGWISDKRGIPCVSGERISNAPGYLGGRILARAAESASKAFGQRNVTNQVTPLGGVFSSLTGDAAQYAGFNALAGGADELSQYLKERAAQAFDVVYVDTGVELAVHIDRELPIDYEPKGRKTTYEHVNSSPQTALD